MYYYMWNMSRKKATIENVPDGIIIRELNDIDLVSLESHLTEAITNDKQITVHVNSNEPNEIIKGTYVAKSISTSGYACKATFSKVENEMDWVCKPPSPSNHSRLR